MKIWVGWVVLICFTSVFSGYLWRMQQESKWPKAQVKVVNQDFRAEAAFWHNQVKMFANMGLVTSWPCAECHTEVM